MLLFIAKFTACLAIFLFFYKWLMEKENMHQFKRFYLLGALVASIIIPNIIFAEYVQVPTDTTSLETPIIPDYEGSTSEQSMVTEPQMDWETILWCIYGLGVFLFGIRFFRNLGQVWWRIRKNIKLKDYFTTRVLLLNKIPPHTFFNYIFLNKTDYEQKNIPKEVLLHEETHAKQWHSIDILLVELAQVILWFNPFIYLLKSTIKLNHEFLADNAVVKQDTSIPKYQHLLLSFLSKASEENHSSIKIANAIVYSSTRAERSRSIKKRFTVMKTKTSKKSIVLRSFLLLPLIALLLFSFSERKAIPISEKSVSENSSIIENNEVYNPWSATKKELAKYNKLARKYNTIPVEFRIIPLDDLKTLEAIYGKMTAAQIKEAQPFPECLPKQKETVQKTINPVIININKKGSLLFQNQMVPIEELDKELLKINDHLSFEQRKKTLRSIINVESNTPQEVIQKVDKILTEYGSATINILGPEDAQLKKVQSSATREEMKEYNTLAKKYNEMDRNHMVIKNKEIKRLKNLYGKMSKKQQADAEPFPNFPPPPPAPKTPEPPKNVSNTEFASNQIESIIDTQDPYDVVGKTTLVHRSELPEPQRTPTYIKISEPNIATPPPPPAPNPAEHMEELAAEGAAFMLNGKPISTEKALEIVKSNSRINIDLRQSSGERPLVKLSVNPIYINN